MTGKLKCNCSITSQIFSDFKYLQYPGVADADGICDKGADKVIPVSSAVCGGDEKCLEMLLKEGDNPDAETCLTFGCRSHAQVCGFPKRVSLLLTF